MANLSTVWGTPDYNNIIHVHVCREELGWTFNLMVVRPDNQITDFIIDYQIFRVYGMHMYVPISLSTRTQ